MCAYLQICKILGKVSNLKYKNLEEEGKMRREEEYNLAVDSHCSHVFKHLSSPTEKTVLETLWLYI